MGLRRDMPRTVPVMEKRIAMTTGMVMRIVF
jgi:hypothetical protein